MPRLKCALMSYHFSAKLITYLQNIQNDKSMLTKSNLMPTLIRKMNILCWDFRQKNTISKLHRTAENMSHSFLHAKEDLHETHTLKISRLGSPPHQDQHQSAEQLRDLITWWAAVPLRVIDPTSEARRAKLPLLFVLFLRCLSHLSRLTIPALVSLKQLFGRAPECTPTNCNSMVASDPYLFLPPPR